MNLHSMLLERQAEDRPVRVGLIGAGKFGSMYLAQVLHTPGTQLLGVADLGVERARAALRRTGWPAERYAASSFADALGSGRTFVTDDGAALIGADGLDVVVDATGNPAAGIRHALACIEHGRHIVMVNVEADVLAGPLLAERARAAGVVYGMAYGDQPALICELVDWARACGFEVICAGKGMNFEPHF
ncbi:MAG TPA: Gfo/Idh/MocA family oxidoreductase, partial [Geminicoccaceae bacterium]|nr:Gfo/Idh/MocA family oxidoreductase [Geminicoccaceae bacterium]